MFDQREQPFYKLCVLTPPPFGHLPKAIGEACGRVKTLPYGVKSAMQKIREDFDEILPDSNNDI